MIVFSDMDGTLTTSEKTLSAGTIGMLDELARRGIEFVPCTGRGLADVYPQILAHPAVHYVVSASGEKVARLDGEHPTDVGRAQTLMLDAMSRQTAHEIWHAVRGFDVVMNVCGDNHCYLPRDMYERLARYCGDPANVRGIQEVHVPVDATVDELIDGVASFERCIVYWARADEYPQLRHAIEGFGDVDVTSSYPTDIEFLKRGVSKGTGLAWLCGHLGIPVGESYAFGDSANDLEMLRAAGTGVAMANADPEAKEAADLVCEYDNDHDGVARTVLALLRG